MNGERITRHLENGHMRTVMMKKEIENYSRLIGLTTTGIIVLKIAGGQR